MRIKPRKAGEFKVEIVEAPFPLPRSILEVRQ